LDALTTKMQNVLVSCLFVCSSGTVSLCLCQFSGVSLYFEWVYSQLYDVIRISVCFYVSVLSSNFTSSF